jgi:hypothetical protein
MRKTLTTIALSLSLLSSACLGALEHASISHAAAPLPAGTWSMDANGFVGTLTLNPPDAAGNLSGTMFGQGIFGYYNSTAQKVTFVRSFPGANLNTEQIYTGFLFHTGSTYDLAGSFVAFNGTGANAGESEYGWYAHR